MKQMKSLLLLLLTVATVLSATACQLGGLTPATSSTPETSANATEKKTEGWSYVDPDPTLNATVPSTKVPTTKEPATKEPATKEPDQVTDEKLPEEETKAPEVPGEDTEPPTDIPEPPSEETKPELTPELPGEETKPELPSEETTVPDPDPELPSEETKPPYVPEDPEKTDEPMIPPEDVTTEEEWSSEPMLPEYCPHAWWEGYCSLCNSFCEHSNIDGFMCAVCGMQIGAPTGIPVIIYKDGELAYEGVYVDGFTDSITAGYAIEYVWGEQWQVITQLYRITCNGEEVGYDHMLYGEVILHMESIVVEPPVFNSYLVQGIFYPRPEGWEEIPEDYSWFDGYKDIYFEYYSQVAVIELMYHLALDPQYYDVYLNGLKVADLEGTFFTDERSLVFIICKEANFQPYTVTVKDRTGDVEAVRTYAFDAPMFYEQIKDQLLNGLSENGLTVFVEGYHDAIYGTEAGAPFVRDTTVLVSISQHAVEVERVDSVGSSVKESYVLTGTLPTMAEFAKLCMGLENFEEYAFFELGGGEARRISADDTPVFQMVAVKSALLKSEIKVEYQASVMDPYGSGDVMEFNGSFTIDRPMTIGEAFAQAETDFYFDFGTGAYLITVNGVEVSDADKGPWFTLIYTDSAITVKSAYQFHVMIEGKEPVSMTLLPKEMETLTVSGFAALLGVNANDYLWLFNGWMWGDHYDGALLKDHLTSGTVYEIMLELKKVKVLVNVYERDGSFFTETYHVEGASITLAQLAELMKREFSSYVWSYYDPYQYTTVENAPAETELKALFYDGEMQYEIKMVSVGFDLMVEVEGTGEVKSLSFEEPTTAAQVIALLGYQWSDVSEVWFEDFTNGGSYPLMENDIIMGFGHLRIRLNEVL